MSVTHPIRLQCKELVEHVTDLLGGDLPPQDLIRLEQHLLVCPPCTLHVQQVRDTIALARETRDAAPATRAEAAPATRAEAAPVAALDAFRRWKAR